MKIARILVLFLAAALFALAGCGSSGSGSGVVVDPDPDGDGIPTVDDAFPNDPLRFAAFESDTDADPFSVVVAAAENGLLVLGGQDDLEGNTLLAHRLTFDPETELGTEATLNPIAGNTYSAVYGVNADGLAVGESSLLAGGTLRFVPVYWLADSEEATELGLTVTIGEGEETFTNGAAYGVNATGQIVGEIMTDNGPMAVLWQPDADDSTIYTNPVALMDNATAHAINDGGWVVGESLVGNNLRATLWMVDPLGGLEGDAIILDLDISHVASSAYGVDGLGRIVGESITGADIVHGALWFAHDEVAESLGENSSAMAISAANERIVGSAMIDGEMRAAVWDTRSTELTNSDAILTEGPSFTPLAGNSRAYAMSQGDIGAVGGLYIDRAFIAVPVIPE
ncbi:Protein of unknown function [Geoalkalibacter ferrihydriticus]|uniref:Uncharacterized protein n=2 Tax=Geoalkalibacter ferrihydriticus TaxID=392333 RepID=A0A0C2EGL7_9BACT|nr:hypothetical protein [Geoalkalibacter ferrihydriticus]KIH77783.1 hypothetical protein GFER_03820 [Geoalkalibacter ferrihydriticus DSM 17813]SDL78828.1 Protein of unknown function [Geoalkalibacter ferrihydriticus]